jgi:sec-independent protein translocase protein TatA
MPLGLHLPELLIILAVALLIFGPKKLPEIGASIGKSISSFKKGIKEVEEGKAKEELQEQAQLEQKRLELEALEHELASKKATASAYEAAQVEHAEASTTDSKLG